MSDSENKVSGFGENYDKIDWSDSSSDAREKVNDPVHSDYLYGEKVWFFWTETWADRCGPYKNEEEARNELKRYCKEILGHVS